MRPDSLPIRKKLRRQGIQALYAFTPFKLLRVKPGEFYSLILASIRYFNVSPSKPVWKTKGHRATFHVYFGEHPKKVVLPYKLFPQKFRRGGKDRYTYIKEKWRYPPTYIEFSWDSLNSGYYCRLGWVLLSSQPKCPQEANCPNLKGSPCPYYSKKPLPYSNLFNVYPRIRREFIDEFDSFQPVLAIRYEDKPLAILRFTDRGSFRAFIDGVVFSPKSGWTMLVKPIVFLEQGLGFEINNVHAIELEFLPETLNDFIKNILVSNVDIARWIILKYKLYMENSTKDDIVREKRGVKAFEKLDKITMQAIQEVEPNKTVIKIIKEVQSGYISSELISFASILFLHSLAHILKNALALEFGCDVEDIDYYIEHPKMYASGKSPEKIRIVLLETAIGGFGYLKNFVESLRASKIDLLERLISAAASSLRKCCEERADRSLRNLESELKSFQENYGELTNLILKAYNSFPNTGVYPHINSIRRAIAEVASEFTEEERSVLDDLLARGPHCWDGCQLCVMLERGCNFLPFDQPFLVSERLSRVALEKISDMIRNPVNPSHLRRGVRKEFENILSVAKDEIDLVSPWISPEVVDSLLKRSYEKHLRVRILTTADTTNKIQAQSLEKLVHATKENPRMFQVRTMEELHAKGMLVDNIILLYGSFNFTTSGLDVSIENVVLDFSINGTKKFQSTFEELWEKAKPLT